MMKEGNRARGGVSLTRACNFLSINLPLFDVGFDISTSGNDTTLCTGSYRYFFLVSVKGYLYLCRYDAGSHNISGDVIS